MTERLDGLEIASGHVFGLEPEVPLPRINLSPVAALEEAVATAVRSPPCLVSFSGGLDSTLVLAIAARVARREGIADPVPITWRFEDAPKAEESEWQERVIRELKIRDWERLSAATDELDLVGPVSSRVLGTHGVLYPPNTFLHEPLLRRAAGGTLLTGIGGDQVLGLWRGRSLADLFARRRWPSWRDPARIARLLAPPRARLLAARNELEPLPWLRSPALSETVRRSKLQLASEPASWAPHVQWQLRRRDIALGTAALSRLAADAGARALSPLLDPGFVAAVARAGGRLGFGDRVRTTNALFGGVLPPSVLERRRKAMFGEVFWSAPTLELIRSWGGEGIDDSVVDLGHLHAIWNRGAVDHRTALLVHQVWCTRHSIETDDERATAH